MVRAAIIGAPGYAGVELTRLVLGHAGFELVAVTSAAEQGRAVTDVYPALGGLTELAYEVPDVDSIASRADVVFLAVPHTAALALAPDLLSAGVKVIDASADYRLKDPEVYEHWYGVARSDVDLIEEAVYGLPELDRTGLAEARLVACPGCYPTATLLAATPAFEMGWVGTGPVIVDAKSGVSGAGRSAGPGTHFPTVNESIQAYKVGTHRHTPEIVQQLTGAAGHAVDVVFTPHLVPMNRGILATVYLALEDSMSTAEATAAYADRYADEPFITVHEGGRMPATSEVRGSNRAHIGIASGSANTLVVTCAIDNLVKGTSGQALQCANLVFGYPETDGLLLPVPVV